MIKQNVTLSNTQEGKIQKRLMKFQSAFQEQGPGPSCLNGRLSANPGLNFNPGFFIFLSKALSGIIFSILFRVSNH